jgi:hypothetical protein
MQNHSPITEPTTTMPRLLLIMSGGVIGFGGLEIGLLVVGAWWVLPVLMLVLVAVTGGIVLAVGRILDGLDGPRPAAAELAEAPEPVAAPRLARQPAPRLVAGH